MIPFFVQKVDFHDMVHFLALDDFVNFCVGMCFMMLTVLYVVKLDFEL